MQPQPGVCQHRPFLCPDRLLASIQKGQEPHAVLTHSSKTSSLRLRITSADPLLSTQTSCWFGDSHSSVPRERHPSAGSPRSPAALLYGPRTAAGWLSTGGERMSKQSGQACVSRRLRLRVTSELSEGSDAAVSASSPSQLMVKPCPEVSCGERRAQARGRHNHSSQTRRAASVLLSPLHCTACSTASKRAAAPGTRSGRMHIRGRWNRLRKRH